MEVTQVDSNRTIDVGSLLDSVAQTLKRNQTGLDSADAAYGGGSHGQRMASAFEVAAGAARNARTNDAGEQFAIAAETMRRQGRGKATQYYANGLELAAQEFQGRQGISADDLGPLLQALAGGAQRGNAAKPGEGSMLDALLPAAQGFTNARDQGKGTQDAALGALGNAIFGAQNTQKVPRGNWFGGQQPTSNAIDPGAASATNIIGGIVSALLPVAMSAIMNRMSGGQAQQQPSFPGGGIPQMGGNPNDPLGGLGDLLGGLGGLFGGGGQSAPQQQAPQRGQQNPLDGLFGGGGNPLDGLFGGGGDDQVQPKRDDSRYV